MGRASELIRVAKSYEGQNYKRFCGEFGGGSWAWCAAFVAVCAKESGNGGVIPISTSCNDMISVFKVRGGWLGKTQIIKPGDIIFYDWDLKQEERPAEHVGIVVEVSGDIIRVIEGNKGDNTPDRTRVEYRTINSGYKYIYGIARPQYDSEEPKRPPDPDITSGLKSKELSRGSEGKYVEHMQQLLIASGYSCGREGADGVFGAMTKEAVQNWQREHKLDVDGICGVNTWNSLLSE